MKKYEVLLTQEEVDHLHLVLGFSRENAGLSFLEKIDGYVSEEAYNNYDKIKFEFEQQDGMVFITISEKE